jgi:cellulose synthase/poly-beta-1,6-N-acetylglucosamine synthase-like glycosyltransferase
VRIGGASVDAAALDAARYGLHRARRDRSARHVLSLTQALALVAFTAALVWALRAAPGVTLTALHIGALILFASAILMRLAAAAQLTPVLSRLAEPRHWPTYTILCPLYREAGVTSDLMAALDRLDYPRDALDIMLLVESDDADTIAAAFARAAAPHVEVVIVPAARPRTKPKALNVGLARARGEYVAVYDAEDRPHPQQLRAALAAFEDGGERLACVQAPLTIDNVGASWIARQFATEYAIQFREILPLLARLSLPLPLGGSSNHFRVEALRAVGGWDAFNVTEDADLGYRFAREGYRAGVIGPPTWEEAPVSFAAWLKQRTRWIKGHLQTWLVLMRNPARTWREMGPAAFTSMQLVLAGGVLAAFAHGPLAFIVLTAALSHYDLLGPADFALALSGYCVAMFAALSAAALSGRLEHARAALTMPFYWPLSTFAAVLALVELVFRPHHWSKTAHGVSARKSHPDIALAPPKRHVSALSLAARGRA